MYWLKRRPPPYTGLNFDPPDERATGVSPGGRCGHTVDKDLQLVDNGFAHKIVIPDAALFAIDQTGLAQNLEVVGNGRLGKRKLPLDVADADITTMAAEQIDDLEPHGMAQGFEAFGQQRGLFFRHAQSEACAATGNGPGACCAVHGVGSILFDACSLMRVCDLLLRPATRR